MDLWTSLSGMVRVELTSADPSGAMKAINDAGIVVFYARQEGDLTLRFALHRADFRMLRLICKRRGDRLTLDRRWGIYWVCKALLKRPVLIICTILFVFLSFYLPTRILFVQVDGNTSIPSRLIAEKASDCGIGFWASRRDVRSEKMKNALLQALPELQWAGVNTSGCTAVISVRERTETNKTQEENRVSSIIATRDGVVRELTVLSGSPVCRVGQAVRKGQLLISGYTDLGLCIRATISKGEIFADTQRQLTVLMPSNFSNRTKIHHTEKKYSVIFGKKQINFYKGSGISDTTCVKMKMVDYMTLPGGFQLPIALVTEEWSYYDLRNDEVPQTDAAQLLNQFSDTYLTTHMVAGQIQNRLETLSQKDGVFQQTGSYICYEMIGKIKYEENLLNDGETD